MTTLPAPVVQVLQAAGEFTPVDDLPPDLRTALAYCLHQSPQWVCQRQYAPDHPIHKRSGRRTGPPPKSLVECCYQLVLEYPGQAALAEHRLAAELDAAVPSPVVGTAPSIAGASPSVVQPTPAEPTDTITPVPATEAVNRVDIALALLLKHPEWSDKHIATKAGCSPANLSQSKRYRDAREATRQAGKDGKPTSPRHRGRDMDEYAAPSAEDDRPACMCGDPSDVDSRGRPLVADGRPRCRGCWAGLTGRSARG